MTHTEFVNAFNPLFDAYLTQKLTILNDQFPEVTTHLRAYAAKGKRIRPFAAFCASGIPLRTLSESSILPALQALELYHLFALIHDDIIDNASTRHGMLSMHHRFGTSYAMLIGDLCLSFAYERMATSPTTAHLTSIFSLLAEETLFGQMLDISSDCPSETALDMVIELKTARYTFMYPIFVGSVFHATKKLSASAVIEFGRVLGAAFQRIDDLADIVLDEDMLGKAPGADMRNGTATRISNYLSKSDDPVCRVSLSLLFGNDEADINSIRSLVYTSGVYEREKKEIEELLAHAWRLTPLPELSLLVDLLVQKLSML